MKVSNELNELIEWVVNARRELHRYPEPGRTEFKTAEIIRRRLDEIGVEYKADDTATVGIIRGTEGGATVALRADIDGLPIEEKTGLDYKSRNVGMMHACGHDAHTAILLGTARLLKSVAHDLPGNVKFFFQPAEETVGGAEKMIQDGCMENPHVDFVAGLHVQPHVEAGKVEVKYGALNASTDTLIIKILGKSSHVAYPEGGIDAVMISGHVITAIHTLIGRYVSPLDTVALNIGKISGGTQTNILAGQVEMSASLRTTSNETKSKLISQITETTCGIARAFGGEARVIHKKGYAPLINNDEAVDVVVAAAKEIVGEENILFKEKPSLGGEDFSFFINHAKGAFYHIGCGNIKKGIDKPLHSDEFRIDEDCLLLGVRMQAAVALKFLGTAL